MEGNDSQFLWRYVQDCIARQGDLARLIQDFAYEADEKGQVWYAVDFSEIHRYVMPDSDVESMKIFSDDDEDVARAIQRSALHYLYFDAPREIILLPSYEVELDSFYDRLKWCKAEDLLKKISGALAEMRAFIQSPDFAQIGALAKRIEDDTAASEDDLKEFRQLLEPLVVKVVSLWDGTDLDVFRLLRELLGSGRLRGLAEWLAEWGIAHIAPDKSAFERWESRLRQTRAGRLVSNYLDAEAMATLKALNMSLAERKVRVHLVTESSTMQRILDKEMNSGSWKNPEWGSLLHTRSFSALQAVKGQTQAECQRHLEEMRKTIGVFLEAYRQLRQGRPETDMPAISRKESATCTGETINEKLKQVKDQWRRSAGLSSSISVSLAGLTAPCGRGEESRPRLELLRLFRLLSSNEALRQLVVTRLGELRAEIVRTNQLLPAVMHSERSNQHELVDNKLTYEVSEQKTVVRSTAHWAPHAVQFYNLELAEWSKSLGDRKTLSVEQVLSLFERGFREGQDYEVLLFIAFLFGVWNRWSLTESYCELAISAAEQSKSRHSHEAKFLLAVALRNHGPESGERYSKALHLIREAQEAMSQDTQIGESQDPRFLREEARIVELWNAMKSADTGTEWEGPEPPPIDDAQALYVRALILSDDPRLKAQIVNNLCRHYFERGGEEGTAKAREYLAELRSVLGQLGLSEEEWLPAVQDTMIWAPWKLGHSQPNKAEQRQAIADLQQIVERPEVSETLRRVIARHIREVGSASVSEV